MTTGRTVYFGRIQPTVCDTASGFISYALSVNIYLTAADTAYIQVTESNGTKVTDVSGGATLYATFFAGTLLN